MAPNSESPVQTQLAIPVPSHILPKEGNPVSRRHVGCGCGFVQTDTGSVFLLELDRADSAQTVKKKMQSMLNMPAEQTSLDFVDTSLKNGLIEPRNNAPVLLTRGLQRSLSTPCSLSSESLMQMDQCYPLQVVGDLRCLTINCMVKEMVKAMECGVEPISVNGGLGGAYYFRNVKGENIAIVKPIDEEPFAPNNPKGLVGKMLGQSGLKRAVRIGETGIREVAAYLLDYEHFSRVPPTVLIKVKHRIFHVNDTITSLKGRSKPSAVTKIASCQKFVPHDFDASEHGSSQFSVSAVHRIGILDIRIFNTDRHGGNILINAALRKDKHRQWGQSAIQFNELLELVPIDHGLCLPETFEDPYFEWLHWPQASLPFSDEELEYISRLDAVRDVEMLRAELPMLREACLRMLTLCTAFLKRAATAGLCLAEIGGMMSRDSALEEASEFELLCFQARLEVDEELSLVETANSEFLSEVYSPQELPGDQPQFYMDEEEGCPCSMSKRVDTPVDAECKEAGDVFHCKDASKPQVGSGTVSVLHPTSVTARLPGLHIRSTSNSRRYNKLLSPPSVCMPSESPSVKGEEEHGMAECARVCNQIVNPTRPQSLKSISFNYGRQRCRNRLPFRGAFVQQGISASETRGKAHATTCSKSLALTDMTEDEWRLFLGFFEELLLEALANWEGKGICHRQRLGMSCQF